MNFPLPAFNQHHFRGSDSLAKAFYILCRISLVKYKEVLPILQFFCGHWHQYFVNKHSSSKVGVSCCAMWEVVIPKFKY